MKRLIAIAMLSVLGLAGLGSLTGCNTVHGAGQDISAGGHAIEGAADRNK